MISKHILLITLLNESKFILLHTVKWFLGLLCITNNLISCCITFQVFLYKVIYVISVNI